MSTSRKSTAQSAKNEVKEGKKAWKKTTANVALKSSKEKERNETKMQRNPKIIEDLEGLLLQTYCKTRLDTPHHLLTAFNVSQWPLENVEALRNYPSYKFVGPQSVYASPQSCSYIDICHQRTLKRKTFFERLHYLRSRYQSAWKNNKNLRSKAKDDMYSPLLFDLAEHIECDPDKFSSLNYDYYYSGGNLCTLPANGELLHVDGKNLETLNISKVPPINNDIESLRHSCSYTFENDSEIFEVKPLRSNHTNLFAVRQRKFVTLAVMKAQNRIRKIVQFKANFTPCISVAQSASDENLLAITTMSQQVRLYDLNKNEPTVCNLYEMSDDQLEISWNRIQAWRDNIFVYANSKQLCLIDLRTTPAEWLKSTCGFHDDEFTCESISAITPSCFSNLIYVGTTHKLHCLDNRYIGRHFETTGSICRWTHQLEQTPFLIKTYRNDNSEFIALGSPVAGDLRICELTRQQNLEIDTQKTCTDANIDVYRSNCLPYQPPTLQEAYENSRLDGMCLQPAADLQTRIRRCCTGLAFCNSEEGATLLSSNSNGDVFAYSMQLRQSQAFESRNNSQSNLALCKYAATVCDQLKPTLNYTDVIDMKAMSKVFRCTALNTLKNNDKVDLDIHRDEEWTADEIMPTNDCNDLNTTQVKPALLSKRRSLGRWQKSLPKLYSYKDALVSDLLNVWDIDFHDEKKYESMNFSKKLKVKPDPETMVQSWLTTNMQPPPPEPMLVIPSLQLDVSANVNTAEMTQDSWLENTIDNLIGVPQSTQIFDDSAIAQLESSTVNTRNSAKKRPAGRPKIKSKYVKGF